MNKKLKFEDLVPNNTVGIQKVTPTVANMPNAAQGNVSYTSLIKNDTINTGAPYRVDAFDPKTTYTGGGLLDGGGGGNDGEGGTVTPMSYEEWYNTAKQNAETTRQNAIGDAQVNYNKSKSEYGSRAESLRNMGLTGAGYSDYLNGQAYAQMQGAIANANAQKASTIADIDAKYMDYINQKEEAAKANYANLLSNITYAWTDADIDNYAEAYGLSDPEQIATLKQTRLDRVKRYLDTNDYDADILKMLLPEGSEDYDTYYNKLTSKSSKVNFETEDGLISEAEASDALENIKKMLGEDSDDYKTLKEKYDKTYKIATLVQGKPVTYTGEGLLNNLKTSKSGDNFKVSWTDHENVVHKYKVQNNGKVEAKDNDAAVLAYISKVGDYQVFKFNGAAYIRVGNEIYRLGGRTRDQSDYQKLLNDLV